MSQHHCIVFHVFDKTANITHLGLRLNSLYRLLTKRLGTSWNSLLKSFSRTLGNKEIVCVYFYKMYFSHSKWSVFYKLTYSVLSYNSVIGLMKQFYFFFMSLHLLPTVILSEKYVDTEIGWQHWSLNKTNKLTKHNWVFGDFCSIKICWNTRFHSIQSNNRTWSGNIKCSSASDLVYHHLFKFELELHLSISHLLFYLDWIDEISHLELFL